MTFELSAVSGVRNIAILELDSRLVTGNLTVLYGRFTGFGIDATDGNMQSSTGLGVS